MSLIKTQFPISTSNFCSGNNKWRLAGICQRATINQIALGGNAHLLRCETLRTGRLRQKQQQYASRRRRVRSVCVRVPARQGSPRAGSIPAGRLWWCREKAHRHRTPALTWRHSLTRMHRGPDCPQVQDKALVLQSRHIFAQIGPHLFAKEQVHEYCTRGLAETPSQAACSHPHAD